MNFKNLAMWGIIVLLSVGLFNMFQNPTKMGEAKTKVAFSEFLSEVELGNVIKVEIQGNNITGVLSGYVPQEPLRNNRTATGRSRPVASSLQHAAYPSG